MIKNDFFMSIRPPLFYYFVLTQTNFPKETAKNLYNIKSIDTPCQGVRNCFLMDFQTLLDPAINLLAVCRQMFYCIFIENVRTKIWRLLAFAEYSFCILMRRYHGLGRRL